LLGDEQLSGFEFIRRRCRLASCSVPAITPCQCIFRLWQQRPVKSSGPNQIMGSSRDVGWLRCHFPIFQNGQVVAVVRAMRPLEHAGNSSCGAGPGSLGDDPCRHLGRGPGERAGRDDLLTVGFAFEDFSTLRHLYDLAEDREIGRKVVLVPELKDPKDLYGSSFES
jgi:hypothetical protein